MSPPPVDYTLPDPSAVTVDPVSGEALDMERQQTHWVNRMAAPLVSGVLLLSLVALGFAVSRGWYWLAVPLLLLTSHFMHGALIGFHEASHGMLRKSRRLNDINGIIAGILTSLANSGACCMMLYKNMRNSHGPD